MSATGGGSELVLGDDERQLADLGYTSHFKREMSPWANFAVGFTYLSPVVGVYTLFAFALATGGPPAIWSVFLAGAGQLLVALVFAEVVSQYPLAGGVYPWARRLWGKRYAWMTGWMYIWALLATIASVSYGAGPYVAQVLGAEPSTNFTVGSAVVIIAIVGAINLSGTKNLSRVAIGGFTAEIVGAVVVGVYLILFEHHQSATTFFHNGGATYSSGYLGAFLAAALLGLYLFYGFEACGDVAEEVKDPGRQIPRSMRMTIYVGGAASVLITAAFVIAVPNIGDVISGKVADPIGLVLDNAFGHTGTRIVFVIVLISFFSCALSLQAAASRMIYSYGRDRMIFASDALSRFSPRRHVPPVALAVAIAIPMILVLLTKVTSETALVKIVSFAALGIYIAFQLVVLAALVARLRGWQPRGRFTLGRFGLAVNVAALAYGVAGAVNLAWPRAEEGANFFDHYLVLLETAIVVVVGLVVMLTGRHADRGDAPAGDAIPARATAIAGEQPAART